MVKTGVLYARVSSKDQEREGYSIPAQLNFFVDTLSPMKWTLCGILWISKLQKQPDGNNLVRWCGFSRKIRVVGQ